MNFLTLPTAAVNTHRHMPLMCSRPMALYKYVMID